MTSAEGYLNTAGVTTNSSKFCLVVDGDECYALSCFEGYLKDCGCRVSGGKVLLDGVIVTSPNANCQAVKESFKESNIKGKLLFRTDFNDGTNDDLLKMFKIDFHSFQAPRITGVDEVDNGQDSEEFGGSLIVSVEGHSDDRIEVVLTGLATNFAVSRSFSLSKKNINVFQVPGNGSRDCLQWFPSDEQKLLDKCKRFYSSFKASVYLISPGKNPEDHPSPEVLSGIIIANAMREKIHKCVIVVTNGKGLCKDKLAPLEREHEVAKRKCVELTKEQEELETKRRKATEDLNREIACIEIASKDAQLESSHKSAQCSLEELVSVRQRLIQVEKDLQKYSLTVTRLEKWQEAVEIYHMDDLFRPSTTTTITSSQSENHEDPQKYLDMSTLVKWSPEGYLSKLKEQIDSKLFTTVKRVRIYSSDGSDVTSSLYKANDVHLYKMYSVDMPWDAVMWMPTPNVWIVKEALDREYNFVELDPSSTTTQYYRLYHYGKRPKSSLWTRVYKTLPDSNERCKFQLIDIQ